MASICLSLSVNLRCVNFDRTTTIALAAPTFVEFLVACFLAVRPKESKRDWLLVLDTSVYFILTILDVLNHTLPAIQTSFDIFRISDTVVGAVSFIPLAAYGLFLFFFIWSDVTKEFPKRLQLLVNSIVAAFIPVIITLDEISSFLGLGYHEAVTTQGQRVLAVGFDSLTAENTWTALNTFTLAVIVSFQAITFFIVMYHLLRVFLEARRSGDDESPQLRGIGWIAAGVKLGAIEALIAFAPPGLGRSLGRRLVRLASRACLMSGAIQWTTTTETLSFQELDRSRKRGASRLSRLLLGSRLPRFQDLEKEKQISEQRRRVTVSYTGQTAPVLQMRFSDIDLPDPVHLIKQFRERSMTTKSQPGSNSSAASARTGRAGSSTFEALSSFHGSNPPVSMNNRSYSGGGDAPNEKQRRWSRHRLSFLQALGSSFSSSTSNNNQREAGRATRSIDVQSPQSDSLSIVHEFPDTPKYTEPKFKPHHLSGLTEMTETASVYYQPPSQPQQSATISSTMSRSLSGKRKPVPVLSDLIINDSNTNFRTALQVPGGSGRPFQDRDYSPPSPASGKTSSGGKSSIILHRQLSAQHLTPGSNFVPGNVTPTGGAVYTESPRAISFGYAASTGPSPSAPSSRFVIPLLSADSEIGGEGGDEFEFDTASSRGLGVVRHSRGGNGNFHQSLRTDDGIDIPWTPGVRGSDITLSGALLMGRLKSRASEVRVRNTPPIQQQNFVRDSFVAEEEDDMGVSYEEGMEVVEENDAEEGGEMKERTRIDSTTLAEPVIEVVEGAYAR